MTRKSEAVKSLKEKNRVMDHFIKEAAIDRRIEAQRLKRIAETEQAPKNNFFSMSSMTHQVMTNS